jgi:hypothetical protein
MNNIDLFKNFINKFKKFNPSLVESILSGFSTIYESFTPEIGYLKDYLKADPLSIAAHDYSYAIDDWLESNDITIPDEVATKESYEKVEWLENNNPEAFKEFGDYVFNKYAHNEGHSKAQFDSDPKIVKNEWLIHFTDDPYNIWKKGFTYGTDDMERLGLSTGFTKESKKGGKFAFAFRVKDYERYYTGDRGRKFKYGKGAVVFQASGVLVFHYGDEEPQVIFDTSTAHNIMTIEIDDENGPYVNGKKGQLLFRSNNPELNEQERFEACVDWIVNNFDQYRKAHSINKKH